MTDPLTHLENQAHYLGGLEQVVALQDELVAGLPQYLENVRRLNEFNNSLAKRLEAGTVEALATESHPLLRGEIQGMSRDVRTSTGALSEAGQDREQGTVF